MLQGLQGKTVLVTGAAGNIGAEAVRRFVHEGCTVVASDINAAALAELAAPLGNKVITIAGDVSKAADAAAAVAAGNVAGGIDLAFINAGVECHSAPIIDFSEAEYDRVFNVNVRGVFLTAQAVLRSFAANNKKGNILITASIAGLQGSPMTSIYNSSKFAAIGIARSLALEVGAQGIRVNVLAPGAVKSRMMSALEETIGAASGVSADTIRTGIEAATGLGRYATPTEIASTAAWVLSDEVPYCHGEIFTVGGGMMA